VTVLWIALSVLAAASLAYGVLAYKPRLPAKIEKRVVRANRVQHIASLEHELMIAGHERDCPPCKIEAKNQEYRRELEIAKYHAWEAQEDVDVKKVLWDLKAARDDYEVVEVTGFGDAKVHYLRGLEK
jgi:hypothetical protein